MTRAEREALSRRVCNFYHDSANNQVKTTVNYFLKQNIPRRTVYFILKKHLLYEINHDRPRSGHPSEFSDQNLKAIVRSVNDRCSVSQRKIARRFQVHQSTISRNLRRRTSVVIRKRSHAPKMDSKD